MSLYNAIFGVNPMAGLLLQAVGLSHNDVPRFRDCFLTESDEGEPRIAVYTRTGGGNRDYYEHAERCRATYPEYFGAGKDEPKGPWNADLRKNLYFVYDADDVFDSTYATFYFRVPEFFAPIIAALKEIGAGTMEEPGARFARLIEQLQSGAKTEETKRALQVGEQLLGQINAAFASERTCKGATDA